MVKLLFDNSATKECVADLLLVSSTSTLPAANIRVEPCVEMLPTTVDKLK